MNYGIQPEKVRELIVSRMKGRSDGRKLALIVEGGAMRGTYTGGSLLGLHLVGAKDIFDTVYATSAGAINAAHFLSGKGHLKAATYYRALADGRFFKPWRFPRPVDVDFVIDTVLRKEIPLEMDLVAASGTPFSVAALNCLTGKGEMLPIIGNDETTWSTLKAAVAMPVVYNKTILINNTPYVDGGIAIPYPLMEALQDEMTDVLVLLSRDPRSRPRPRGLSQYLLWSIFFANWETHLIETFERSHTVQAQIDSVSTGTRLKQFQSNILTIFPESPKVNSSTMDKVLLREGCIDMARKVMEMFGVPGYALDALIRDKII